jgi:hypothetical protein
MPVDVRAQVFSNLGNVISGQLSDDLLQPGVGLLRTTGEVTVSGLIQPSRGTEVKLGLVLPGGKLTRLPRLLRVMKAESDPYQNQTTLQVGCLLAMNWDYVKPEKYWAYQHVEWFEDYLSPFYNQNQTYTAPSGDGVLTFPPVPIPQVCMLDSVVAVCLDRCSITAADGNPAINKSKSVASIDLSTGFLAIASQIICESGMYGFIDAQEKLRLRKLLEPTTKGPMMSLDDLITMEAIGDPAPPTEINIIRTDAYGRVGSAPPNYSAQINNWKKHIAWSTPGDSTP